MAINYLQIAALVTFLIGCGHVFTLKYSPEELNSHLKPLFPLEQVQGPFTLKLTQPTVKLNSKDNLLGVRFDLDAKGLGLSAKGSTLIEGAVEYRRADHAFYVVSPSVSELSIQGVPPMIMTSLRKVLNVVAGLALKDRPVYTLNPALAKEALAITYLKDVRIVQDHLVVQVSLSQ